MKERKKERKKWGREKKVLDYKRKLILLTERKKERNKERKKERKKERSEAGKKDVWL